MLHLNIELRGRGWLVVRFADGNEVADLEASYLTDTPRELVEATNLILQGQPEARFSTQQEPGECRAIMRRDADALTLHVLRFDQTFSRMADAAGKEVLQIATQPRAWGNAVWRALDALRQEFGLEGYEQRWGHPFPMASFERLGAHFRRA